MRIEIMRSKPYKEGQVHILAGKCKCANCGKILASNHSKGVKYLICPTRTINKELCSGACIQVRSLEEKVLKETMGLIQSLAEEKKYRENQSSFTNKKSSYKNVLNKNIMNLKKEIENYQNSIKTMYLDKVKGIISENQFIEFNTSFSQNIKDCNDKLIELQTQLNEFELKESEHKTVSEVIKKYENIKELTPIMVSDLIQEVKVGTRIQGTKEVPIKIIWKL